MYNNIQSEKSGKNVFGFEIVLIRNVVLLVKT